MTRQKVAAGESFEHAWLLDAQGAPTRDPRVLEHNEPRGSLQLMGGPDYGHKGFGLALMIEALSQGLSGHGRADAPKRWGGNTFRAPDRPRALCRTRRIRGPGESPSDRCRANRPVRPAHPVRIPGDQAARGVDRARSEGIELDAATAPRCRPVPANLAWPGRRRP